MAIDWSSEPFSRLYKRETDDDLLLSWEARAVWHEFLKRCDASGLVATKRGVRGFAALIKIPVEVVERVLQELLEDGRMRSIPDRGFVAPNYVSANYVARSPGARQAAHRAYQRAEEITNGNTPIDAGASLSRGVTRGHAVSRDVTRGHENCQSINHTNHTNHHPLSADDAGASKSRTRTRHSIPEDWEPRDEERRYAESIGLNCDAEAEEFKTYWLGDGRPKKNWDQTFRNRLQSQAKRGGSHQGALLSQPIRKVKTL